MKINLKSMALLTAVALATLGCSSSSNTATSTPPPPGNLTPGGAGLPFNQVVDGTGAAATAHFSTALAVNNARQVVGFAELTAGSPFAAALWTVSGTGTATATPTALPALTMGGFAAGFALDAAGDAVGQAHDGTRLSAVVWKHGAGAAAALPALAAQGNYAAYAISADGTLAAGEAVDALGSTRAVLWVAGVDGTFSAAPTVLPVGILAAGNDASAYSSANGLVRVSADEILAVGEADDAAGESHALLWRSVNGGATFTPVDLGIGYSANAVNALRQVVGEYQTGPVPVAWVVDSQGVASAPVALDTSGRALAINVNGWAAGWSTSTNRATVWHQAVPSLLFSDASQVNGINDEDLPLVVGFQGSYGFIRRIN